MVAGPRKQPAPDYIYCQSCEDKLMPRGGYLMGGWGDWVGFPCTTCKKVWYWTPDKEYFPNEAT